MLFDLDFPLQRMVEGYWNRADIEIDLVAIDDDGRRIRFGTCKRDGRRLARDVDALRDAAAAFLKLHRRYAGYRQELVAIAPAIPEADRRAIGRAGALAQPLDELVRDL